MKRKTKSTKQQQQQRQPPTTLQIMYIHVDCL